MQGEAMGFVVSIESSDGGGNGTHSTAAKVRLYPPFYHPET